MVSSTPGRWAEREITRALRRAARVVVFVFRDTPLDLGINVLTDVLHLLITRMWAGGDPIFLLYNQRVSCIVYIYTYTSRAA